MRYTPLAVLLLVAPGADAFRRPAPYGTVVGDDAVPDQVRAFDAEARRLAGEAPRTPEIELPAALAGLDYDGQRAIRALPERRPWQDAEHGFVLEPLHLAGRYRTPVRVDLLRGEERAPYAYEPGLFALPEGIPSLPNGAGFAGLRAMKRGLRQPDVPSEFLVFHGASYFRAVGAEHSFGTSARGLAIDTAMPEGEEFPAFTRFLVEEPGVGDDALTLHALLESPSVTGSFRFDVRPGVETVVSVDALLFPRGDLDAAGIAPLTSMFQFAPRRGRRFDDFRGAVHDANGLAILTGENGHLWRPLQNGRSLQVSAFLDDGPRGFGLAQRRRGLEAFGDLEARYDTRPTVWIEPVGDWGRGSVVLVEIPTETEFNDNVVAFWRPEGPLRAGEAHRFRYRMRFLDRVPGLDGVGEIVETSEGAALDGSGERLYAVDVRFPESLAGIDVEELRVEATASRGAIREARVQAVPGAPGRVRMFLRYDPPEGKDVAEIGACLVRAEGGACLSERWMWRWSR